MPKEEWGVKRICPTTGRRFYDLKKTPIISPYTGETITLDANTRTRAVVAEKVVPVKETADDDDVEDLLVDDDDDDDARGDDLLEDDEDGDVSLDEIADVAKENDDA